MKKNVLILVAFFIALVAQATDGGRCVKNFNLGWRFHAGDVAGAEQPQFDDASWRVIDVPHDFQIEQPWVSPEAHERPDNSDPGANIRSRLSSRGFKEMGVGWYRKEFVPESSWKDKRVLIDFEGIMYLGDVYLNGERIGGTDYGYVGFEIDITKRLQYGKPNVIAVKADTSNPQNSRWYTGGGLFRDVHLVVTDAKAYFMRHPLYITTPQVSADGATVNVQAEIACYTQQPILKTEMIITDANGQVVAQQVDELPFNRKMRTCEYKLKPIQLEKPLLWDCENPHLYKVELTLYHEDGSVADRVSEHFGVRTVEFSPEYGLKLNGKKVLLKGIANHHTLGALGAAAYDRAIEKRIQLLKEFGVNHIRTSHNPYSKGFMNLCDKYGILVVDELYDKWLDQYCGGRAEWASLWQKDIPEWIKRDRNHPSVVLWSLGNELQTYWNLPHADWGVTPYRMQRELLKRYDDTRLITVAMHPRGRSLETDSLPAPLVHETDIASYNYRYMYFPGDSRRFPNLIFYQSEANTSNMGPNFFEMDLDKVIGLAYWGQIDYLGESGGWPAKGWAQGAFDISLQPKPIAYLLKSMFTDEPVVHIGVIDNQVALEWNDVQVGTAHMSENWNRVEGEVLSLYTYTNAEEVELVLNGKSLGVKKNTEGRDRNKLKWDNIKYAPGYLEAVAKTNGKVVARHRIETTGKAVALKVVPDNANWKADGMDLQHLRVVAVDKKGRRVLGAEQQLTFAIEGDAKIVAVDNGNIVSDEMHVSHQRKLFKGSAMIILRAGQTPGEITLITEGEGFKKVKTKLQTY
ncbi:MAG: glycoside hydrolase family 2 protein [Mediterranea massiliensis]|nr:glycoside hydrolase family 2 protein [Mediterranea massiliensis]